VHKYGIDGWALEPGVNSGIGGQIIQQVFPRKETKHAI